MTVAEAIVLTGPSSGRVRSQTDPERWYAVTLDDDGFPRCSCAGFSFRKDCRHVRALREALGPNPALNSNGSPDLNGEPAERPSEGGTKTRPDSLPLAGAALLPEILRQLREDVDAFGDGFLQMSRRPDGSVGYRRLHPSKVRIETGPAVEAA